MDQKKLARLRRLEDFEDLEAVREARLEANRLGTISLADLRASLGL